MEEKTPSAELVINRYDYDYVYNDIKMQVFRDHVCGKTTVVYILLYFVPNNFQSCL